MGRRKGSTAFPVARIKKMMQSDDDVGKIATATPVLVAKALECMMEDVLRDAAAVALARRTKTVTPQHLKHSVSQNAQFDFLRTILRAVPALDDPNAPPVRRAKRPRAQHIAATVSPTSPPSSAPLRPKRARPVRDDPRPDDGEIAPSKHPPLVSTIAAPAPHQPPHQIVAPPAHEEEEEDYDDCDDEGDDSANVTPMETDSTTQTVSNTEPCTPPLQQSTAHVAPLILKEQPGLGAPRHDKPNVKAAERVSVHALLS